MHKESPILFNGEMVRAILEGHKSKTRRICKLQPHEGSGMVWWPDGKGTNTGTGGLAPGCYLDLCPFGQRGDRLWVRETWASPEHYLVAYQADGTAGAWCQDGSGGWIFNHHGWILDKQVPRHGKNGAYYGLSKYGGRWRPSIHMPKWASRILLDVVSVRVERLQDISEEDARAEGIYRDMTFVDREAWGWEPLATNDRTLLLNRWDSPRNAYRALWESINGPGSWDANPWVWCVEFKRVEVA